MKEAIHPDYKNAKIICNCGNVIETRSTRGDFHIEICASCHPFFTGKQKIMDTAGRIEKFKTRYGSASSAQLSREKEEPKKAAVPASTKKEAPKENRAAKRAKTGKTKAQTAPTPAPEAAPAAAEPKAE